MGRRTVSLILWHNLTFRITHFVGNKAPETKEKLLVGLNVYGSLFMPHRRAITGKEYIQLLEKLQPEMDWDGESEESFFEFTDGGVDVEVWYPSLYSIKYPPHI